MTFWAAIRCAEKSCSTSATVRVASQASSAASISPACELDSHSALQSSG